MTQDPNQDGSGVEEGGGLEPPYFLTFKKVYTLNTDRSVLFNPVDGGGGVDPEPPEPEKPKYQITFTSAYKVSNNRLIRFNKDSYVPVDPSIYGVVSVPSAFEVFGSLYLEPRPTAPIHGNLTFPNVIGVSGTLSTYRLSLVYGNLPFPTFSVEGAVSVFTPYYVSGTVTLSSETTIVGSLGYKDDAFRGLVSDTGINYKQLFYKGVGVTENPYQHAKPQKYPNSVPFRWCSRLSRVSELEYTYSTPVREHFNYLFNFATPLQYLVTSQFTDTVRHRVSSLFRYRLATQLHPKTYNTLFREMIRLRYEEESAFHEGVHLSSTGEFSYRHAIPVYVKKGFPFRWCSKVVALFKRSPTTPPDYVQPRQEDFNLRFKCAYRARNATGDYNIYFNMTRCKKPYVIKKEGVYTVENTFSAKRVIDGQNFEPLSAQIDTDMASWCWSISMVIPDFELPKVVRLGSELPLVEVVVNGDVYVFLLDNINRSRRFGAMNTYTLTGRSISSLLSADSSTPVTYTNATEISAVQLVKQLVADCVGDLITVEWEGLVSDIGWVLPANAVSFSGKATIDAIVELVKTVGGVVFTHPSQPVIVIKKAYPYAHWETPTVLNHTLSEDVITDEGTKWDKQPLKNAVYVTDLSTGNAAKVLRRGTSGDKLAPELVSSVVSTVESMEAGGKSVLIQAAPSETKNLTFPFLPAINHVYPCDTLSITTDDGSDWGTITNVSLSATTSEDAVVVEYAVSVRKFMETMLHV
ncbi:MAG: hypothetical protein RR280_04320 [Bacteroidaceae bacterium]